MSTYKLSSEAEGLIDHAVKCTGEYWRDAGFIPSEVGKDMAYKAKKAVFELKLYVAKLEQENAQHESEVIKRLDRIEKNTWALRGVN